MKNVFFLAVFLCLIALQAQAQTEINSSYFQVLNARSLGPSTMSGRITAIDGTTVEGQVNLYVGSAGGGVWKSQNGGLSFSSVFDKYCQSIGAIAINQQTPKTVYVGTGESNMRNTVSIGDGLYKTTDGGSNWQKIGLDSTEHISKILIDPSNQNTIYVAAPGPLWKANSNRGLYKSINAGKAWKKILFINDETGCADIAIHPQKTNVLFASFWQFTRKPYSFTSGGPGSGLYKSVDGGETWKKLNTGFPDGDLGRIVITINPSKPQEVLAIVESKTPGLYISEDEGESWKKLAATENITARPFYFSALVFDPSDNKRVYRPAFDFEYSIDGGYSWSNTVIGGVNPHSDHHTLWVNPLNNNQLFLGTDGGVYASYNKGVSWNFLNNLPVGQFYHVSTDKQEPYNIYGGMQDNYSWMGPNTSPGGVTSADWRILNGGDGFWVQTNPFNSKIVFAESQGGNMNRINLQSGLATSIKPQKLSGDDDHRFNWSTPIVIGKSTTNKSGIFNLYTGSQYLFKSTDEGRNWQRISPDLTTNDKSKQQTEESGGLTSDNSSAENYCTIYTITQNPTNENNIWVGTDDGNLQVTINGGKTWKNISPEMWKIGIPKTAGITCIELSSVNKNQIFVTFDNHGFGDHTTYLVQSIDGGNSWKQIKSPEFTGFAHVIRADIKNANLLFLGTEMGLFISLNGGKDWMRSKYQNLPWYSLVRDIQIEPKTNDLIIATHGRGIYIIDNLNTLRKMVQSNLEQEVLFYTVDDFKYDFTPQYPFASPNISGLVGESKVVAPAFYYYLKQKSNDVVKIEILNDKKIKIRDFTGTSLKGLNKAVWPMNINPPKVAKGGFIAGSSVQVSSFIGPKVVLGKYFIRLIVNGKSYEQPINILPNPEKGYTEQTTKKLHQQGMHLFGMQEKLAVMVDSIDMQMEHFKNQKNKTAVEINKLSQLEELYKNLIETNRKNIFFDEFKYRRKLSDLYLQVAVASEPLSDTQEKSIEIMEEDFKKFSKQYREIMLK